MRTLRRPSLPRAIAPLALAAALLAAGRPAAAADQRTLDLSAGVFQATDPSSTGFYVGIGTKLFGTERLAFGFQVDYVRLRKTVTQVVTGSDNETTVVVEDENSRHYIPAFLTVNFALADDERTIRPYLLGGVGWATLRSYHENTIANNSRSFFGPVVEGGAGVSIHQRFFIEGSFHGGTVKRSSDEPRRGTPLDEEASPTGVAIRAGFRL